MDDKKESGISVLSLWLDDGDEICLITHTHTHTHTHSLSLSLSLSVYIYIYICDPRRLSTLAKELTVATHVIQSSSNKLSTPVSVSVNVNKRKINSYTFKFFRLLWDCWWLCYQADVKLIGLQSQLEASLVSSHTNELWFNEIVCGWIYIIKKKYILDLYI